MVIVGHDARGPGYAGRAGDGSALQGAMCRKMRRTAQRVLPVGGHHLPARAPVIGIAHARRELAQEGIAAAGRAARHEGCGVAMQLHEAVRKAHAEHPQPETAAQAQVALERPPARPAPPARHCDIDAIGDRLTGHGLLQEGQRKAGFQLDHHRLGAVAQGQDVGRAHLGLDGIAKAFKPCLDGRIQRGFGGFAHARKMAATRMGDKPALPPYKARKSDPNP